MRAAHGEPPAPVGRDGPSDLHEVRRLGGLSLHSATVLQTAGVGGIPLPIGLDLSAPELGRFVPAHADRMAPTAWPARSTPRRPLFGCPAAL